MFDNFGTGASKGVRVQVQAIANRFKRRLETTPPDVEESLLLRVLVQALVLVGIAATDVAASTGMSFWAVPLSLMGAFWSWQHRHKRNTAAKFCIAIGMLLALAAFFVGLRGELNDTRLVLAELLVQLQVLHSFDLPRRKDLGYSMVIGLILISVACTLSQTMTFGLLLLLFLAIALPVLVLDYRSRLGLQRQQYEAPFQQTGLAPKQLLSFLLVILVSGLLVFACLPRFPGYQLRSFPVSPQIQKDFEDNSRIINPGYVKSGTGKGEGSSSKQGEGLGPGKLDENFYYGFNSRINQNLRGALKPRVVLRIRSQAEGFWRVLAFDRYLGQGWEISRNDRAITVTRPDWSYQFFLPRPTSLSKTKEIIQTYTAVSDLPNLLPALTQAKELYFPTRQVAIDPNGNVRSPLELREGLTYTVISEVPYRDRTRLRDAPQSYPPNIVDDYLNVPPKILERVRQRTQALLATSPKPITSAYEKALFLAQAVKQRYTIQTDLPFLDADEDLVEAFLFKYQGGYPDHFSTALTVMLRSVNIPARFIAGFGPGEFNPFTGLYIVRNTDAYAITEVFFPKYGWFAFDPIPGHELIPPSIEENQTFSVLRTFWRWVAGWLPSPVTSWLGQGFGLVAGWIAFAVASLMSLFSNGWIGLFVGLLLGLACGFVGWLLWRSWRNWRYRRWLGTLPPMERFYQQMLTWLALQGFRKQPAQTPLEYAQQSYDAQPAARAAAIDEISQAYVRWRYGGSAPNLTQLKQRLRELKQRSASKTRRKS
ncbi:transglutaminase TgpA family protein [Stenomitos frigidus]|uniref:Transglutaminase n=1 Tax=Stenomitos frigidus ULC18 TaxID=2107698 RepID=A0A2T1ELK0_9CYAN|nr:transglutaminaseTgpA domain-containing protein [Stenomitos frigidus]PSB33604.1 transglutaminase [Stenomitos frigidus ULC18]